MQQYRLKYSNPLDDVLGIAMERGRRSGPLCDFRVRAVAHDASSDTKLTEAMTLAAARSFIAERTGTLGEGLRDCLGLVLDEEGRSVDFVPIEVGSR